MRIRSRSILVSFSVLLAAWHGQVGAQTTANDRPTQPSENLAPTPGDIIRLQIWMEPELSGEFPVDQNRMVVLPRIGRFDVSKETPESLEEKLVTEYSRFLTHRSIDVTVLRRIQVLGAVRNPGVYPLDPTMTVADAVASAGGATREGHIRSFELIRHGERVPVELFADARIADSPIRSGDQLYVPERSWLSRNAAVVVGAITGTLGLAIAIAR
jgi:protein involved in polysaccharide export with SLBB domain